MLIGYRDLVSDQDNFYLAFKPQIQHVYSRHCSPYFSYFTDWENLLKHQDISSLVIIWFILMICTFNQVVILLGEIGCWSLLGLRGSMIKHSHTCLLDNLWILKGEILSKWNKLSWGRSFDLNTDYVKLFSMMKIPTGAAKILTKFNFDLLLLPLYFSNFFILISDLPNENISLGHYQLCIEVVGYRSATQTHLEEESWHWISKT